MSLSEQNKTVIKLIGECRRYRLSGFEFLETLTLAEITYAYNGIGPEWLHPILRNAVDHLAADLRPAALIHDVRYTYGDGSREWFDRANDELEVNGISLANQKFRWYNPMRYITRARARTYAALCRTFGWEAYCIACGKKS